MKPVQLEFDICGISVEDQLRAMQKKIDEMEESMARVRRNLFAQVAELHKTCAALQEEILMYRHSGSIEIRTA